MVDGPCSHAAAKSPVKPACPAFDVPPSWFYNPYTDGTVRDPRAGGGS